MAVNCFKPSFKGCFCATRKSCQRTIGLLLGALAALPFALAAQTNCTPPPSGLVSWWAGEGNANDSADNNHGVLQGGMGFAAGKVGQAFNFNGTNAYIAIAARSNLNVGLGSGLTFECWMKPADLSGQHLIAEWNDGSAHVGVQLQISVP